jgi:hypothetical protein
MKYSPRVLAFCDVLVPLLWGISLVIFVIAMLAFKDDFYVYMPWIVINILAGWRVVHKMQLSMLHRLAKLLSYDQVLLSLLAASFMLLLVGGLSYSITYVIGDYSQKRFNEERTEFLKNPNEFPFIRDFARSMYDIDVVLGGTEDAWLLTSLSLNIPGASPASMRYSSGHCVLNMNKSKTNESYKPKYPQDAEALMKGILIHEFGHCLDVSRDYPNFGQHIYKTHSIAPVDKANAIDAETYVTAAEKLSTILWREVFSDILQVGYWRLANPTRAQELADEWRNHRFMKKEKDPGHASACWLDQLKAVEDPSDFKSLLEWADIQRSTFYSKCSANSEIELR